MQATENPERFVRNVSLSKKPGGLPSEWLLTD